MFLTFANITFKGIKLPQSIDGSFETQYGQIPIIGSKPVMQGTGEKLDEFDITALFHIEFCTPREEMDALQTVRKNRTVDNLVDGTGRNLGKFVITTISESVETALENGYPTAISCSIHFMEYNTNAVSSKQTGTALSSQNPVPEAVITAKGSSYIYAKPVALSINEDMIAGKTSVDRLNASIVSNPNPSVGMYKKIGELATSAKASFQSANDKVEATKKIVYRAINLRNSYTMIISAIDEIKAAANSKNANDMLTANNKLSDSILFMDKSYAPVAAFIGSREGGENGIN